MVQAVMTAGARAVVASLWPVPDASTRALFEAFYAALAAGESPAAALQAATALVRGRPGWAHPYYWAAFTVNGMAHERATPVAGAAPQPAERSERVEQLYAARPRGGDGMSAEQIMEDAAAALEGMTACADTVAVTLPPEERPALAEKLAARLADLEARLQSVHDAQELLQVGDAIQRLVEDTPAFRRLLLDPSENIEEARSSREITTDDYVDGLDEEERRAWVHGWKQGIEQHLVRTRKAVQRSLAVDAPVASGERGNDR